MPVFKPEDFNNVDCKYINSDWWTSAAAHYANKKLEVEGKVVYGHSADASAWIKEPTRYSYNGPLQEYKALLIGIEKIEACQHPKEKVFQINANYSQDQGPNKFIVFECSCGKQVQPKEFEEVKE